MFDKTSNTMQSSTAHTCRASSPDGSDTRSSDDVPKLSSCASAASTCTWMQNHQHINRVNDCTVAYRNELCSAVAVLRAPAARTYLLPSRLSFSAEQGHFCVRGYCQI